MFTAFTTKAKNERRRKYGNEKKHDENRDAKMNRLLHIVGLVGVAVVSVW